MWFQCRITESVQLRITVPLISLSGRCELLMWSVVLFGRFGSLHAQPTFRIESSDWQLVIGPQPPTLQPCRERPHALMPPCCIFKSCLPRGHWPHVHPVRRWEQVWASRAYRSCIMQNLTAFIMILCICWAAVEKNDNISDLPIFILPLKSRESFTRLSPQPRQRAPQLTAPTGPAASTHCGPITATDQNLSSLCFPSRHSSSSPVSVCLCSVYSSVWSVLGPVERRYRNPSHYY